MAVRFLPELDLGIDWFDQLGRARLHQTLDTAGQSEISGADGIKVQYRYR